MKNKLNLTPTTFTKKSLNTAKLTHKKRNLAKNIFAICCSVFLVKSSFLFANTECLYDLDSDYANNCTKEFPLNDSTFTRKVSKSTALFGYKINSAIGIPACAIMTSNGIKWASKAGYDVLTYKTVRSRATTGHPLPNIVLLQNPDASALLTNKVTTMPSDFLFESDSITVANSMGIPSFSLEWVLEDIAKSRASLSSGQVLIVSIIGNPSDERTIEQDFAFLAKAVSNAGAHIIEANLSCPNVHSSLATYKDPIAVSRIINAIYNAVPNIPLILKVGIFDSVKQMEDVFIAAANAKAKGICGINTIPMQVVDSEGKPAFGENRTVAGVSGEFIRPRARDFVVQARQIIMENQLDLTLLATGGVMKPEHFDLFFEDGADIVLSATGTMWNPNLAIEFHGRGN